MPRPPSWTAPLRRTRRPLCRHAVPSRPGRRLGVAVSPARARRYEHGGRAGERVVGAQERTGVWPCAEPRSAGPRIRPPGRRGGLSFGAQSYGAELALWEWRWLRGRLSGSDRPGPGHSVARHEARPRCRQEKENVQPTLRQQPRAQSARRRPVVGQATASHPPRAQRRCEQRCGICPTSGSRRTSARWQRTAHHPRRSPLSP